MCGIRGKLTQDVLQESNLHCLQYQRWRVFREGFYTFLNGLSCRPRQGQSFHTKRRQLKKWLERKSSYHHNCQMEERWNNSKYITGFMKTELKKISPCSSVIFSEVDDGCQSFFLQFLIFLMAILFIIFVVTLGVILRPSGGTSNCWTLRRGMHFSFSRFS